MHDKAERGSSKAKVHTFKCYGLVKIENAKREQRAQKEL